jgi:hypothetical protein
MAAYYIIPVCVDLRFVVYSAGYSMILYGDSFKCRGFITVGANLHNYHTNKWIMVNKLYVTCLCYGSLLSSLFV